MGLFYNRWRISQTPSKSGGRVSSTTGYEEGVSASKLSSTTAYEEEGVSASKLREGTCEILNKLYHNLRYSRFEKAAVKAKCTPPSEAVYKEAMLECQKQINEDVTAYLQSVIPSLNQMDEQKAASSETRAIRPTGNPNNDVRPALVSTKREYIEQLKELLHKQKDKNIRKLKEVEKLEEALVEYEEETGDICMHNLKDLE